MICVLVYASNHLDARLPFESKNGVCLWVVYIVLIAVRIETIYFGYSALYLRRHTLEPAWVIRENPGKLHDSSLSAIGRDRQSDKKPE